MKNCKVSNERVEKTFISDQLYWNIPICNVLKNVAFLWALENFNVSKYMARNSNQIWMIYMVIYNELENAVFIFGGGWRGTIAIQLNLLALRRILSTMWSTLIRGAQPAGLAPPFILINDCSTKSNVSLGEHIYMDMTY